MFIKCPTCKRECGPHTKECKSCGYNFKTRTEGGPEALQAMRDRKAAEATARLTRPAKSMISIPTDQPSLPVMALSAPVPGCRRFFFSTYEGQMPTPIPLSESDLYTVMEKAMTIASQYSDDILLGRKRKWRNDADLEAAILASKFENSSKKGKRGAVDIELYKAELAKKRRKCASCGGSTAPLLLCCECMHSFHAECIELPDATAERIMNSDELWRCMDCKVCEGCHESGNEKKLLFCDDCDRGYHTYCLDPPLKSTPNGRWVCPKCVKCKSCGATEPGKTPGARWRMNFTMCEQCAKLTNLNQFCPVCQRVYHKSDKDPMVCCDSCDMWVHIECDNISLAQYEKMQGGDTRYTCPKCKAPARTAGGESAKHHTKKE